MNSRRAAAIALGLFAAVSVAYVIVDEATREDRPASAAEAFDGDRLIAYYFHGNRRCKTCNAIEAYSREALETAFAEELRTGRLVWKTLNFEEPANAHFRGQYALYTSTLVLSDVREGKEREWYELDETWHLVRDKSALQEYVERETRALLEAGP